MPYPGLCQLDQGCCKGKNNSKWCFKHWTCCCRELFPPKEFKNEFSGGAWSQLVPFSPETPIWKGRCKSDHFGLLDYPSNPVLRAPVSNCVSEHVDVPSSETGKQYITLSLLLQLVGEPKKCWSQTGWPKPGAHHQLLRNLQETVPKGGHCSIWVLDTLFYCLCFPFHVL